MRSMPNCSCKKVLQACTTLWIMNSIDGVLKSMRCRAGKVGVGWMAILTISGHPLSEYACRLVSRQYACTCIRYDSRYSSFCWCLNLQYQVDLTFLLSLTRRADIAGAASIAPWTSYGSTRWDPERLLRVTASM